MQVKSGNILRTVLTIMLAAFFIHAGAAVTAHAEQDNPREYLVKAAMIFNFAKFVEWPDNEGHFPETVIHVCIIGDDPFGETIETINSKKAKGRKLEIKRIISVEEIDHCEVLYVSKSEKLRLANILDNACIKHVLTISDIDGFAESGGVVGFTIEESKVRFEINLKAAERSSLKISSRLLKLADIVGDN